MMFMKVNEIFTSIEGEGLRTGSPVTFIRLYGCNLCCTYCDTRYSCEHEEYDVLSIVDILDEVERLGMQRVTLSGGEPLIHPYVHELLVELSEAGYEVNVETNGSVNLMPFIKIPNVFFTADYKSNSSGMNEYMDLHNLDVLREQDVLKFVVGSHEDLEQTLEVIKSHTIKAQVYISPVFGKIEPVAIVRYVLHNNRYMENCRVQVQLHKIIWNPKERGV